MVRIKIMVREKKKNSNNSGAFNSGQDAIQYYFFEKKQKEQKKTKIIIIKQQKSVFCFSLFIYSLIWCFSSSSLGTTTYDMDTKREKKNLNCIYYSILWVLFVSFEWRKKKEISWF